MSKEKIDKEIRKRVPEHIAEKVTVVVVPDDPNEDADLARAWHNAPKEDTE